MTILNNKSGVYFYGFSADDLSICQLEKAIRFQELVEPWLVENLSPFNEKWHVVLDHKNDSLQLLFDDIEDETWFKLAWMQGGKLEQENRDKAK